jgi:protein-S-isoprenylcysteine O-methyltransferase Ste14
MRETSFYHWYVIAWMALAALTFVVLFFVTAPYGRFTRSGWGPRVNARVGWILMETPVLLTFLVLFAVSDRKTNVVSLVFLALFAAHYVHRALIYPFRMRTTRPSITIPVILMAVVFNVGNGYLNARYLFTLGPELTSAWLTDARFVAGVILFASGYALNQYADKVLIDLRADGHQGYKIPRGGVYEYVSCPNYLGEMLEWAGWALACWNLGALAFFVWTVANLAPRAIKTHRWYKDTFPDYPEKRKALVPFVV